MHGVVLSVVLPDTGDSTVDLEVFRRLWRSLLLHGTALIAETRALLFIGVAPSPSSEAMIAEATAHGLVPRPHLIVSKTWGRSFNDAFLFAISCEGADVWVHLDEDHVCTRPFWNSARAALGNQDGSRLWQLQFSNDWGELPQERLAARDGFTEVFPHPDQETRAKLDPEKYMDDEPYLSRWPVFSLRPGVNVLDHFRHAVRTRQLSLRPFDEDAEWVPLQWKLGLALEKLGASKGILLPSSFEFLEEDSADVDFEEYDERNGRC